MTAYLLKWAISLLGLLVLYKGLLASQPLPRLKRVYLLAALLIPLIAPLVTLERPTPTVPLLAAELESPPFRHLLPDQPMPVQPEAARATSSSWLWLYGVYGLGTLLMLARFAWNLSQLTGRIRGHPARLFRGVTLVLLPDAVVPHTFLNYLFVSEAAFKQGQIRPELLTHELAHIRQRHSLDVLLVEIISCFGWFNPLLFWLKQLMQFNHECLADEAVVRTGGDVQTYQHLLLDALTRTTTLPALVSTLTFQTTKQRLLMMTKHASPARTQLVGVGSALLFATLVLALVDTVPAQNAPKAPLQDRPVPANPTATTRREPRVLSAEEVRKQFGEDVFYGPDRKKAPVAVKKKVDSLLAAGKRVKVYMPPPLRNVPTEAQWEDFKNTKKYGVWVDGKRRRDNPVSKYKRTDVAYFWYSYVHKNARQPEGYLYQLELYTEAGYQKVLEEGAADPLMIIDPDRKGRR